MHKTPPLNDKLVKITHRKCILWLGSSLSNMPLLEVITLLSKFVTGALKAGDTFLIGVDHCRDMDKVKAAYSESSDCWKAYVRNGVKNAGKVLGGDAATKLNGGLNWEYVTRWDAVNNRHMVCAAETKLLGHHGTLTTLAAFRSLQNTNIVRHSSESRLQ